MNIGRRELVAGVVSSGLALTGLRVGAQDNEGD